MLKYVRHSLKHLIQKQFLYSFMKENGIKYEFELHSYNAFSDMSSSEVGYFLRGKNLSFEHQSEII